MKTSTAADFTRWYHITGWHLAALSSLHVEVNVIWEGDDEGKSFDGGVAMSRGFKQRLINGICIGRRRV